MFQGQHTFKVTKTKKKAALILLFVLSPALTVAQTSSLKAKLSEQSKTQCRRGSVSYEIYLSGHAVLTNTSDGSVLVANHIEVVPEIRVALSKQDAYAGKFLFTQAYDYFYAQAPKLSKPSLNDLLVLKSGESGSASIAETTLLASKVSGQGTAVLRSGTYWIQLRLVTLPEFFWLDKNEADRSRKEWMSVGLLLDDEHVWTEPFPVTVKLDPRAEKCQP